MNIVEVRALVTRQGGKTIHEGLDLEVAAGEVLAIVGGSGSGKTTLLRVLLGLLRPVSGTVRVLGADPFSASKQERQELRARQGVLFQGGALFSAFSVHENVAFPLLESKALPRDIVDTIARLKITMAGLSLSDGPKLPAELSGGMVKRAALARALALDPELLFLDEPTSGLDPISSRAFCSLILEMRELLGLTVLMITHDPEVLEKVASEVAVIADKKIIAKGPMEAVSKVDHPFVRGFFASGAA